MRRLDEGGEAGLVQMNEPVNKFPEFVTYLVRYLKRTCPTLGKDRIAKMLARAGLHLGVTTVGWMLKRDLTPEDVTADEPSTVTGKAVTAKRPNHIWHVDLTTVPTRAGFGDVCAFLNRVIERTGSTPKYLISDKGKEFFCGRFKRWCRSRSIRPRFGAVGEHGSIAIVERFIRSMKSECTQRITMPFHLDAMRCEIASHATWYNEHRPHSA
jgi:transposase InsO family protein